MRPGMIIALHVFALGAGCAGPRASGGQGARLGDDLEVRPLAKGVWLHVSTRQIPGYGPFPSNGLIVLAPQGALLVDTPYDDSQTRRLLRWIKDALGAEVKELIVTHSHDDRMGGIKEVLAAGAVARSLPGTAERAQRAGRPAPTLLLEPEVSSQILGERVETFFPGPAHAPDNLVVWLPERQVLFGGCLVRAASATGLGNLEDADVPGWRIAIEEVTDRFSSARTVVPGHGAPGSAELFAHTRELVEQELSRATPR